MTTIIHAIQFDNLTYEDVKSYVTFWKEVINDRMDSIMSNNTLKSINLLP